MKMNLTKDPLGLRAGLVVVLEEDHDALITFIVSS
jgi:hypothetical protein